MNKFCIISLKAFRRIYTKTFRISPLMKPECVQDPNLASDIIYSLLISDKPCLIGRFGSNELLTIISYIGIKDSNRNVLDYIKNISLEWWWNEKNLDLMRDVAGFFPRDYNYYKRFCELMLNDIVEVDVLGSWLANERHLIKKMSCQYVHLRLLEPWWSSLPWSRALANKKVLVVHPFDSLIKSQYLNKRLFLFKNKDVLPEFELITIKSVQSHGKNHSEYEDWFQALQFMKDQIDQVAYDICLIGAGAYGFPIAAHVKRQGKKAVHLGGALQLLFGIRGKRWDDSNYGVREWGIPSNSYVDLMNQHWIRPTNEFRPKNAEIIEGACYW
jgi:hypothetical protein